MALARSASGPGGLSINTGAANSLFGSSTPSQPPVSSSLFGASSVSQAPATGGLSGSSTTSTPQSQGLLAAPQPTQTAGGLFGSLSATSKPQTGSGLFGSTNAAPQPQQSGGIFGSMNNASQPQQSSGLFSSLGTLPAQNQNTNTGGLFGSANIPQVAQSGGLFSNLNNQSQNKPSGSLFGGLNASQTQPLQQQQQQQQPTGGLFSSLNRPTQPGINSTFNSTMGGGLRLGQSQGQQVPGVRIDISQMKGTTRFNDLHEDVQKQIENIDKIILAQQSLSAECDAIMPSHSDQLSSIPTDVDFLSKKLIGVESSLESDAEAVALVGNLVKSDAEHAKLSFRAIDNLKLPAQYHNQGNWMAKSSRSAQGQDSSDPQDLVSFFSQTADEMASTLSKYQSHISEIEQHLRTVEAATMMQAQQLNGNGLGNDVGDRKRELAAVLREFEAGIRGVAGVVAETREEVQRLQLGGYTNPTDRRMNGNGKRTGIY